MSNEKEEEDKSKYNIECLGKKYSKDLKVYKIIILGLKGVGKTSIIHRLLNEGFDKEYLPTFSIDINTLQVKVNDEIMQFQFWDLCGDDKFVENTKILFKNVSSAILVYAINDRKSFDILEKWYNLLKDQSSDCIIFIIGNKSDLKEQREVEKEEVENFKNNNKVE